MSAAAVPGRELAAAPALPAWAGDLAADTRARLAGLQVLPSVDSTNAHALRQGPPPGGVQAWFAEHQAAGRGRLGRRWQTPPGAQVALSLSRAVPGPVAALAGLSLAIGVAATRALRGLGFHAVGLKWPNDLLAGGRKLGGILVELQPLADGRQHVVAGLGVNVALPADTAIDQPWCDLAGLRGAPVCVDGVRIALLDALVPLLADYERLGLAPWLAEWARYDTLAGRPVRLASGETRIDGIAEGIDESGALRLRTAEGELRLCHAGEASLRAA